MNPTYNNKRLISLIFVVLFFSFLILLSISTNTHNAFSQIGKFGTFSGTNFKFIKDSELFQLEQFSIAAWFKTNTTSKLVSFIVDKGGTGSEAAGENMNYGIWLNSLGQLEAGFETSTGVNYFVLSLEKLNDNKWHYSTVTYDGSILKLFVDGILVNNLNTTNAQPDNASKTRVTIAANALFNDKLYEGNIDELRIWDRPLTTAEVYDAFTKNKFDLDGQLIFASFGDNIACKQTKPTVVTAIHNSTSHPAEHIADSNSSTRWSQYGIGSWIQLDLGKEKEICDIDISWYKGDLRKMLFTVSTSSDGQIFNNILSETSSGHTSNPEKYDIPDIKTRYLKLTVVGNSNNDWSSISEVDINNPSTPGSPSPCPELKIPANATFSIGSQNRHPEKNAVDNNLSTRWSNLGLGSWIQFNLGKEKEICNIGIAWYKGDIRTLKFIVSVSSDGDDFRQVFSGKSKGTNGIEIYDIPDTSAKYLRVSVTGNSMNNWASISEVNIFGKDVKHELISSASVLNVITQVINNDEGNKQPGDFIINVTGLDPSPKSFRGDMNGKFVSLSPGDYKVTIDNDTGYKPTFSAGCEGSISSGENRDCVITLDDILPSSDIPSNATNTQTVNSDTFVDVINATSTIKPSLNKPELKVILEVVNIYQGKKEPQDFIIKVNGENAIPNSFRGNEDIQIVSINPGKYEVLIDNIFGYEIQRTSGCAGTIDENDKTCIIELIDLPIVSADTNFTSATH